MMTDVNYFNEGQCMNGCFDELCSAVSFNRITKKCQVNRYGRVILKFEIGFTSSLKGMQEILRCRIFFGGGYVLALIKLKINLK